MSFDEAIENAIEQAMISDPNVIMIGEDVQGFRRNLFVQFGGKRVRNTPISEAGFVGASVAAAMAGLRPVVEVMLVDFIGVPMDAIINHAAKTYYFSGNQWHVPLVIRVACGGGYGDGGQHEQSLWGWLAHIPGLTIVVPSNPLDAGALMTTAIQSNDPVLFFEHKMLSEFWLEVMGIGGRDTVTFELPEEGIKGQVPEFWKPLKIGKARIWRKGTDLSLVSLGLTLHYCIKIADQLKEEGVSIEVIDLRYVAPLDIETLATSVKKTRKIVIVDEDYTYFGLSGEITAVLLEQDIEFKMRRVGTNDTIPYDTIREVQMLPNMNSILKAVQDLT